MSSVELNSTGKGFMNAQLAHYQLSTVFADSIRQLSALNINPYQDFEKAFLAVSQHLLQHQIFTEDILTLARKQGAFLLSNVPIDVDLPPTPDTEIFPQNFKKSYVSEFSLLCIGSILGSILSYKEEKAGAKIHNIYPVPEKVTDISNQGSEKDLLLHTENAFDDNGPDYLILLCLRKKEQNVSTYIADIDHALSLLDQASLDLLHKNDYLFRKPDSFGDKNIYIRKSIINKKPEVKYAFDFNSDLVVPISEEARNAYHKAKLAFDVVADAVVLTSGQALIINNNRYAHGRAKFQAQFNGNDRWLQRVYISDV